MFAVLRLFQFLDGQVSLFWRFQPELKSAGIEKIANNIKVDPT